MKTRLQLAATGLALAAACAASGCATWRLPTPEVLAAARQTTTYSARLGVSYAGPRGRARTAALVAFARPDSLRVEIPGPSGARVVAVARAGRLTAVFPREHAVFEGTAAASDVEAALGIELTPGEIMDLLVGEPPARLAWARVRWGERLPRDIDARFPDGTRLHVQANDVIAPAELAAAAFADPPHAAYRVVDAGEARELLTRR
jgi:hypothetical protein